MNLKSINKIIVIISQILLVILLLVTAYVAYGRAEGRETAITVRGTPVTLVPPVGFELAADFSGFIDKQSGGTILVAIFPDEAVDTVGPLFTNRDKFTESMAPLGFEIKERKELRTEAGKPIIVYSGKQRDGEKNYDKWVTLIAEGGIYMVTLQAPEDAKLSPDVVLNSFRSITILRNHTLQDQVAALPFSFEAIEPFRPTSTLMGSAVTLHIRDNKGNNDEEKPSLYIIRDTNRLETSNPVVAQNLYLISIKQGLTLEKTSTHEEVSFAGRNGQLLIGKGKSAAGQKEDIILYTAIDSKGYAIYLQATAREGKLDPYSKTIKNIASSVRLKP